ncbi:PH domain-containing protein [Aridibaculum aurantiacum]|uniref:PH domain-containing protein n=1 Tax=Aridibaculum aurantiacum TaxID=2810307 RepID=UPI001A97A037|nr:PH domain-containing protein [Aridibaculum aurantiacum]
MIYRSKISWGIWLPAMLLLGVLLWLMITDGVWLGLIIILLTIGFILQMIFTTTYIIENETLVVKCGFLYNKSIPIASIRKIRRTNNPISSPAASFDRIDITYNKYDHIIISPKNKAGFIAALQQINPAIDVDI